MLRTSDAARRIGISRQAVRQAVASGRLACRIDERGHRHFDAEEVERFKKQRLKPRERGREGDKQRDKVSPSLAPSKTKQSWHPDAGGNQTGQEGGATSDPETAVNLSPADANEWSSVTLLDSERTTISPASGELAARAFSLFRDGRNPAEAVIELQEPPSVIKSLFEQYLSMTGGWLIPRETRRAIESRLGAELTPDDLLEHVERLMLARFELRRFTYECCRCGKLIQASAEREWADVVAQGALADWGCAGCE